MLKFKKLTSKEAIALIRLLATLVKLVKAFFN